MWGKDVLRGELGYRGAAQAGNQSACLRKIQIFKKNFDMKRIFQVSPVYYDEFCQKTKFKKINKYINKTLSSLTLSEFLAVQHEGSKSVL